MLTTFPSLPLYFFAKFLIKIAGALRLIFMCFIKLFSENVVKHKKLFKDLIYNLNDMGKKIFGYGASTKGNVILQYCKINNKIMPFIVDVNSSISAISLTLDEISDSERPLFFNGKAKLS